MVYAHEGQAEHEVLLLATVTLHATVKELERVLSIAKVDSYLGLYKLEKLL